MNSYLLAVAVLPLVGFFISLFSPKENEKLLSYLSIGIVALHVIAVHLYMGFWILSDESVYHYTGPLLYSIDTVSFYFSFYYDKISAIFLTVGSILMFLVVTYSRIYMHREKGFKRFFNTILLFYSGYTLVTLSGNFEVLFAGWEILGISSFLLISFYRERYLPVKNAFKVFSIYRLGDVGFVLAAWMCHIVWEKNIQFAELANLMAQNTNMTSFGITALGLLLLLSACAKSAQFPFCSWLPRAMEGPTPSSAIFYGSLSIHMGVFILLRTQAIWEHDTIVRVMMGSVGLVTAFTCNGIAKVQSSIKSQIAYSSLTQIGIMFVELAVGLENLALFHFAGNAFLRTYQLLVSPSIVSYRIREQSYSVERKTDFLEKFLPPSMIKGLYILSVKEWNVDYFLEMILWRPMKRAGSLSRILLSPIGGISFVTLSIGLFAYISMNKNSILGTPHTMSVVLAALGLIMVLLSFSERNRANAAWTLIFANHIWITAAVAASEKLSWIEITVYLSGAGISWLAGTGLLMYLKNKERDLSLSSFQGHVYDHPKIAFWFLLCCLGLSGFPITPTFIGEDVIFHHIHQEQFGVALCAVLSYIIDGLAIIRIYSRVFMGPHIRTTHEISNRSS
jgi:NADH-quinone oxidoreductase subunit L